MRSSRFLFCLDLLFLLPKSERQPVAIFKLITLCCKSSFRNQEFIVLAGSSCRFCLAKRSFKQIPQRSEAAVVIEMLRLNRIVF